MAERRAVASIGLKSFLTGFFILFFLMMAAGILTRVVPAGTMDRTGASAVVEGSYRVVERPDYPAWRWLTAPVEVLGSDDAPAVIAIILFIVAIGGSFAVLQEAGILTGTVEALARRAGGRKYALLAAVTLFFMSIGSLMGIFEEVIPLVPVAVALAATLGWSPMVGLGMSILATGFGFAAAISNPFTLGAAQRLAGLPVFSGAPFRILVFVLVYGLYLAWLIRLARKSERGPGIAATATTPVAEDGPPLDPARVRRGITVFALSLAGILAAVMAVSLTGALSDFSMPITALLFLFAGCGAGFAAGLRGRRAAGAFGRGVAGLLPGVVLILMAMGVKHIIVSGMVMDSLLHAAASAVAGASDYGAAAMVYVFTLFLEFFISSGTAKAFLVMPILAPLADLTGLSRQVMVQAYAFGDGFSNMLYPTNAVLLISLGLVGMSWPAWFRRTWLLQLAAFGLTMGLLMLAVAIGYR